MQTELIVATVSAVVALSSAAIAIRGQLKTAQLTADLAQIAKAEERRFESEKAVSRYREPWRERRMICKVAYITCWTEN
jgi:hypothetical protein